MEQDADFNADVRALADGVVGIILEKESCTSLE
jgi:hypothetical protein